MNMFTRLTLCLTILVGVLVSQRSSALFRWGNSAAKATENLYNLVMQGPPQYSLTDEAEARLAAAKDAYDKGADVNYVANPNNGLSLLHYAATFGDYDMAVFLITCGANPCLPDAIGNQPWVYVPEANKPLHDYLYNHSLAGH
jgi:hypothetical protein